MKIFKNFITHKNTKYLLSAMIGASSAFIYSYFNPSLTLIHSNKDPKFGLKTIKAMIEHNKSLNDAIAVISTQSATQFGKEFYNDLDDANRRSIIAHPYDKQGSGVSVTVIYFDEVAQEYKTLLMQKLKFRNKPELGLKNEYNAIGGYTKGAGVEGSIIEETSFEEDEARDKIEDSFLDSGKYESQTLKKKHVNQVVDKDYQNNITIAIGEYYRNKLKQDPYIAQLNPFEIKEYLKSKNISYLRDYNQIDTAWREFTEETGFNGNISQVMIKPIYLIDNYAVSNVANLHTIGSNIVINLGTLSSEPIIYEANYKQDRKPNSFQPNNSEIGKLIWASASDIVTDENNLLYYNDIPVKPWYVPVLNNVHKYENDQDLEKLSNRVISKSENIDSWVEMVTGQKNSTQTHNEFGPEQRLSNRYNRCFAQFISEQKKIDSDSIARIDKNCRISK